jgi:hypothetical protein
VGSRQVSFHPSARGLSLAPVGAQELDMRIRRRSAAQLALVAAAAVAVALPAKRAAAQGSLIDRAKKSMTDAASAAKKGLSDETTRQINSAVDAAAAAEVSDGAFNAAVSPWTSSDGAKRVELARFSGSAFVVTNGASRQIVLCDDRGLLPWLASVTIADGKSANAGTPAASATTGNGRGSGAPTQVASTNGKSGRGGASGAQRSSGETSGRGGAQGAATASTGPAVANGEVVQAGAKGVSLPTAIAHEYRLPSNVITFALPTANGASVGAPSIGSLQIGSVSESIFSGAAKVRFAQATIPGSKTKETVDLGVVFKARVLAEGQTPGECLTSGGGKGSSAAKGGDTKGGDAKAGDAKGGDAKGSPPSTSQPGTPSTPARGENGTAAAGGASFAEGDVLLPKIANVKLIADSKDGAKLVATLTRGEELVYLGQEQNGYLHVQAAGGEGWVRKALLSKR